MLKGVGYSKNTTGVTVYDGKDKFYYTHTRLERNCHGTGDVFASAFTGLLMRGKTVCEAVAVAADFVVDCIRKTDEKHWYGVSFEPNLSLLTRE